MLWLLSLIALRMSLADCRFINHFEWIVQNCFKDSPGEWESFSVSVALEFAFNFYGCINWHAAPFWPEHGISDANCFCFQDFFVVLFLFCVSLLRFYADLFCNIYFSIIFDCALFVFGISHVVFRFSFLISRFPFQLEQNIQKHI